MGRYFENQLDRQLEKLLINLTFIICLMEIVVSFSVQFAQHQVDGYVEIYIFLIFLPNS